MVGDDKETPVLTGFEYFAGNVIKVRIEVFDADDWELHSIINIQEKLCTYLQNKSVSALGSRGIKEYSVHDELGLGMKRAVLCLSRAAPLNQPLQVSAQTSMMQRTKK